MEPEPEEEAPLEVEPEVVEVEPKPEEEAPLEAEAAAEEEAVAVPAEDDAGAAQVDAISDGEAEADEAEPTLVEPAAADNPFPPGCRGSHAFFGSGTVRESRSKDEHWRLEVEFEDGSTKTADLKARIDTENELDYLKNGGILHYVLRRLAA